mmetsp:Transcript_42029/g.104586  ORF Transcript_42029/g.104586 Transcript_42029/m.104586 type:complete len:467 (+) Transcript_42029:410-1810(+)
MRSDRRRPRHARPRRLRGRRRLRRRLQRGDRADARLAARAPPRRRRYPPPPRVPPRAAARRRPPPPPRGQVAHAGVGMGARHTAPARGAGRRRQPQPLPRVGGPVAREARPTGRGDRPLRRLCGAAPRLCRRPRAARRRTPRRRRRAARRAALAARPALRRLRLGGGGVHVGQRHQRGGRRRPLLLRLAQPLLLGARPVRPHGAPRGTPPPRRRPRRPPRPREALRHLRDERGRHAAHPRLGDGLVVGIGAPRLAARRVGHRPAARRALPRALRPLRRHRHAQRQLRRRHCGRRLRHARPVLRAAARRVRRARGAAARRLRAERRRQLWLRQPVDDAALRRRRRRRGGRAVALRLAAQLGPAGVRAVPLRAGQHVAAGRHACRLLELRPAALLLQGRPHPLRAGRGAGAPHSARRREARAAVLHLGLRRAERLWQPTRQKRRAAARRSSVDGFLVVDTEDDAASGR